MTRKEYWFVADVLRHARPADGMPRERTAQWEATIDIFCTRCKEANPGLFKEELFREACRG